MIRTPIFLTFAVPMRKAVAGAARQIAVAALLSLIGVAGLRTQATTTGEARGAAPTSHGAIVLAAAAP